ncbi:hypothetical protein BH10BAC3_BH10BAC3_31450 [soil metagenome]
MKTKAAKLFFICVLFSMDNFSFAQKNIVISDSLAANADKFNVKMGSQGFGKIWKMHFGDYSVVSSKMHWTTNSTKGNLFNTKTESKSTQKFSFVFSDKTDTANVNAAQNILTESLREIEIIRHLLRGTDELVKKTNNFTAFITVNGDTTDTWALFMNVTGGTKPEGVNDAFLSNGNRKIILKSVTSGESGGNNMFSMAAEGYEFIENGHSLAALQYTAGPIATNKNIVWINRGPDSKMKLILAAAQTAILQIKATPQGY